MFKRLQKHVKIRSLNMVVLVLAQAGTHWIHHVRQRTQQGTRTRQIKKRKRGRSCLLVTNGAATVQPTQAPLETILKARTQPGSTFPQDGFFLADSGTTAYLSQLLLRAGDIKTNPGPTLCGSCKKRVGGNSIKCTWCEQWIHQKCSGLSRKDITQLAKANTYAFECNNCRATATQSNPDWMPQMEETRGTSTCADPTQDPSEAERRGRGEEEEHEQNKQSAPCYSPEQRTEVPRKRGKRVRWADPIQQTQLFKEQEEGKSASREPLRCPTEGQAAVPSTTQRKLGAA